jgi:hypothetical protein
MKSDSRHEAQLAQFVAAWKKLDGFDLRESIDSLSFDETAVAQYRSGPNHWHPLRVTTDRSALETVYAKLPARFPPLYEELMLNYRWLEVDLQLYRLHANPAGSGLLGLLDRILKDKFLSSFLLKNGFIPFAKGPDMDYDPVCFDLKRRKKNKELAIVKLDHEEILCNERIKIVGELAPSFEQLVLDTIQRAAKRVQA